MIWLTLFLLCLCSVTFALCVRFDRCFEQTVGPVLLGCILLALLPALAGILPAAALLLPIAGVLSAGYLLRQLLHRKFGVRFLTPGFWIFAVLCLLCWWNVRGRLFAEWDEFSHWGLALKNMYATGKLYTQAGSTTFADYPPAMTLLEYLLLRCSPVFREDLGLFSMGMFSVSLLVYPLGAPGSRYSIWLRALPCGLLLALTPSVFSLRHYTSLYVDGIMGVLLAFACFVCLYEKASRLKPWLAGMALSVLTLTKGAGFPFALMGCFIVFFALNDSSGKKRASLVLQRLIPLFLVLLSQFTWKLHLLLLDIGTKWVSDEAILPALLALVQGNAPAWRNEVITRYLHELLHNAGYGWFLLPYVGVLLLLTAAAVLITAFTPSGSRRAAVWCSFGLIGAVVIYTVSLLYSYLFLFDPSEALSLASVSRYLGTPITALLAVITAQLFTAAPTGTGRRWIWWSAAALICLQMFVPTCRYTAAGLRAAPLLAAQTQHDRYLAQHAAEVIRTVSDGSDVYFISPQDNGAAITAAAYELAPAALPEQNSGIGCLYPEDMYGGYTVHCTPDEWSEILYNGPFRYVYLYQVDGYFVTGYRSLFEDEDDLVNDSLLEILRQADGSVLLRRIN